MSINVAESIVCKDRKTTLEEKNSFVSSKEDDDKINVDLKLKEKGKEPEKKEDDESTDNKQTDAAKIREEAAKDRKERMASLEARMAERRRQRVTENRKKQKSVSEARNAFKQLLDKNAPNCDGSKSLPLQRADSNINRLLKWTQKLTDGYPGVEVTNFSSSWADGLAFCALMHNFVPNKIKYNDLTKENRKQNFELAFSVATEEGVPELLEVEDMVRMKSPEPKSLITYLHTIYQVMVAQRR